MKDHKSVNKHIRDIESEKLKVKTCLCDKDLSSVNLFSKTYDFIKKKLLDKTNVFIKMINLLSKTDDFIKNGEFSKTDDFIKDDKFAW